MKYPKIDYPEKKTKPKPLSSKIENKSAKDTIHAIALLKVPSTVGKLTGGWARFCLLRPSGGIEATFVETLSLSAWDMANTGVGAWRTLTIPTPPKHTAIFQAKRGDVDLVKFYTVKA